MPIRPENKARYPRDWKTVVVPRIAKRSGNRCECTGQCGINHGLTPESDGVRCQARHGGVIDDSLAVEDWRYVVLTVMHLNHQPEDCSDKNLLHGCQGCHNRYDAPVRRAGIKARRRAPLAVGDLFQCEEA